MSESVDRQIVEDDAVEADAGGDVMVKDLLPRTRLFERLEQLQPPIGACTGTSARELVEIIGDTGFDYVVVDMLLAPTSWESAANLAAAALQFNMTPWIRLQSYPWGDGELDTRLAADVLRAQANGFQVMEVVVDGPGPIREALRPRYDNHSRVHLPSWDNIAHSLSEQDYAPFRTQLEERRLIVPSIVSARGIENLDAILEISDLRMIKLAMGPLTQALGYRGVFSHPEVQKTVREIVEKATKYNVKVVTDIHGPTKTPEEVVQTATWMWDAGVSVIEVPAFNYFLNHFYGRVLNLLRIGSSHSSASPAANRGIDVSTDQPVKDLLPRTRLFERLEQSEPAVGTLTLVPARELVEIVGDIGFDYVKVDMLLAPTSWESAANLAAAALQFNMTPWIRLQSFPWGDGEELVDTRLAADVLRAQAIGFQVISISTDGPGQIREALRPRLDNHYRTYLPSWDNIAHYLSEEDYAPYQAQLSERRLIVPLIESKLGFENLDEILELPGLRLIWIGLGDLTQVLGYRGGFSHPKIQQTLREIVEKAAKHNVKVGSSAHGPRETPEDVLEAATWMRDAGVAVIQVPPFNFFVSPYYKTVLERLRTAKDGR